MLAAKLLGLAQTEFMKSFEIAIQTGAILAVLVLYGRRFIVRFDVWVLSFRGAGKSTTEGFVKVEGIVKFFTANVPAFLNPTTYDKSRMRWSIDDYIDHDFPAVLEFVCKESQRQEVSVIGHSLGGLVALCYLTKHPTDSRIKQFVAIGAPGVVIQPPNDMLSDVARNEALYYSTFLINAKVTARGCC
jgi:pimeloyl-ACP methyl ester carboxylesterase